MHSHIVVAFRLFQLIKLYRRYPLKSRKTCLQNINPIIKGHDQCRSLGKQTHISSRTYQRICTFEVQYVLISCNVFFLIIQVRLHPPPPPRTLERSQCTISRLLCTKQRSFSMNNKSRQRCEKHSPFGQLMVFCYVSNRSV